MEKKCLHVAIMQITLKIAMVLSLMGSAIAKDSKAQTELNTAITLNAESEKFSKVLCALEKQSKVSFIYSSAIINSDRKISLAVTEKPLGNVLDELLPTLQLAYEVSGNVVLLKRSVKGMEQNAGESALVKVTGKVTDVKGETLPGVSIKIAGTTTSTVTNALGEYQITAQEGSSLVFSYIGFETQTIPVREGRIDVVMKADANLQLNEVVVVGYGTQKRSDITGSVTSVPKERLQNLPVTNVLHAIEGSVAGVNITQNSSVPGSSASALIRGVNSISATTGPFIVLDGIPYSTTGGTMNDINPNDIESIEVLKDASAVAIYGTRGANGVILITTKRGKSGKPAIKYNGYAGIGDMAHVLEPMTAEQYVEKYKDWMSQMGRVQTEPVPTASELANFNAGKTTDWIKEVSQNGYMHNHNLSISGGSQDIKYYVSGDFLKEEGVLKGYQYQRASIRSNLDANITSFLTAGASMFFTSNNYDGGRVNLTLAQQMSPYGQLYNVNGGYEIFPMRPELLYTNPLLGLTTNRIDRGRNFTINSYAEVKPSFLKGLKYRINASYTYAPLRTGGYSGRDANSTLGSAYTSNTENNSWVIENLLTYTKDWNKHHLDATALYSAQQSEYFLSNASSIGFINDLILENNLGAGATQTAGSNHTKSSLVSQMGRLNYSFDSRYLFTVTARRDGYSAFGTNTSKYGVFPSFAVGWNISNESFMKQFSFINNLKLRGSYGKSGNQAIGINQTSTTSSSVRLPYNGISTIGVLASSLGNEDLHWESTIGTNIGLDFSFLGDRIGGTIDAYKTKSDELLLKRRLPAITGYYDVWDNLGKLSNKGIEVTLRTVPIKKADFKWESNINFSANRNKLVSLYGDGKDDLGNRWFLGQPVNVIYDYKMIGVWQEGEDASQHDPGVKPGDLKFADINGDKKITADDRAVLGQTTPKWIGGFTNTFHYKNLHLNVFIQTFQGALRNNEILTNADQSGIINIPAEVTYWTPDNKSNSRPAIRYTNPRGYGYPMDASYTRLKDITLSYTVPSKLTDKLKLASANVYLSGRNLYTSTDWIGWDPEYSYSRATGTNSNNYPLVRTMVFGANISLR